MSSVDFSSCCSCYVFRYVRPQMVGYWGFFGLNLRILVWNRVWFPSELRECMNIFGERAELASRMRLDCLQSAFSLKICLVLIAASCDCKPRSYVTDNVFVMFVTWSNRGGILVRPYFAQSSCLLRFTWYSLLAENVFTFKHNYSRSS